MPTSVSLTNLSYRLPNGTELFSNLTLQFGAGRTGLIGRNGTGKSTLLRIISGALEPFAGTVRVHGSLGLLKQDVQHGPAETVADLFGVQAALEILKKAEAGTATLDELSDADWTLESRLDEALAQMALNIGADHPLAALSGGQVTRVRLAALLFEDADFLLLDEPTNNLDADGRQALREFLQSWRKGALVVSHDRALLEHMDAIVELTSLGATSYGGNWSFYRAQKQQELAAAEHSLARAEKQVTLVKQKAQQVAERKARKDGAGKRARAKGDQPKILLNAMRNRAENSKGDGVALANRQQQQAEQQAAQARDQIEVLEPISVSIASSGLARAQTVLKCEEIYAGYAQSAPIVSGLSFQITGPERVALVGGNGSGKTTLLNTLLGKLPALSGSCQLHETTRVLDQHASLLDANLSVVENFRRLNPQQDENTSRAVLARFLFRGKASEQTVGTLSGGMMLRAGLACVLGAVQPPKLLVLDEPTNHLDLDAIEAIEAGLNAYDGALLVVSHDETFLQNISVTRRIKL